MMGSYIDADADGTGRDGPATELIMSELRETLLVSYDSIACL